jgi:hypothetical protein
MQVYITTFMRLKRLYRLIPRYLTSLFYFLLFILLQIGFYPVAVVL